MTNIQKINLSKVVSCVPGKIGLTENLLDLLTDMKFCDFAERRL